MSQKRQTKILILPDTNNQLDLVFETLDQMHTAASEGNLSSFAGMSESEAVKWLNEVIYTAQEAIREVEKGRRNAGREPVLHLLNKRKSLPQADNEAV